MVAAIHVIEHFAEWEAPVALTEWVRVLKPGGLVILELPSLDKIFSHLADCLLHRNGQIDMQSTWWGLYGDPRYHDVVMLHRWGYTTSMLHALLQSVGCVDIHAEKPRYHMKRRDMRMTARKATYGRDGCV